MFLALLQKQNPSIFFKLARDAAASAGRQTLVENLILLENMAKLEKKSKRRRKKKKKKKNPVVEHVDLEFHVGYTQIMDQLAQVKVEMEQLNKRLQALENAVEKDNLANNPQD